jgi:hypothetical protein
LISSFFFFFSLFVVVAEEQSDALVSDKQTAIMNLKELFKVNHKIKLPERSARAIAKMQTKTKQSKVFDLKFGSLANMFYAALIVLFHVISLAMTVKRVRALMQSLMLNLSLSITEKLSTNTDIEQSNHLLGASLNDSKFFITNQFSSTITLIVFSAVFLMCFVFSSLFRTGNLANDNLQLGDDLIEIDEAICKKVNHLSNFNNYFKVFINSISQSTISGTKFHYFTNYSKLM